MIKMLALIPLVLLLCINTASADYKQSVIDAEKRYDLPFGTMQAISKIESNDHPWTLNVNSIPMIFPSQEMLIQALRNLNNKQYYYKSSDGFYNFFESKILAELDAHNNDIKTYKIQKINIASTDICGMQLNYKWQNHGFTDVVEMTDIYKCTDHAARFVKSLIKTHGYITGVGCYHYCNPKSTKHKAYVERFLRTIKIINPIAIDGLI